MNERTPMRLLDIEKRKNTLGEVALGYNEEEAIREASRCLNCKNAKCIEGCPVNVNIPKFISLVKENKINEAYKSITEENYFPGICGRVCPQEKQCEAKCIRGIKGQSIAIGRLERYVCDNYQITEIEETEKFGKSVGIIGGGPAGISCASECLKLGFDVTIYEALHKSGGVLLYGIPEFRLPEHVVVFEIANLRKLGAKFETDTVVGKTIELETLYKKHDFLFIGVGAGLPRFMNIPGENLNGVMSANEFLTRVNLMVGYLDDYDTPLKEPENVVVVGGGNVALDAARCALRLGGKVTLVYRRSKEEMPARAEEIEHALEEGIIFKLLHNPIEIIGDSDYNVKEIVLQEMELTDADESGRRSFRAIPGKTEKISCDTVIMAIGNYPNPILKNSTDFIEFDEKGLIVVDDSLMTTRDRIYAGGDIVTGAATVISAMGAGKKAARAMYNRINAKKNTE